MSHCTPGDLFKNTKKKIVDRENISSCSLRLQKRAQSIQHARNTIVSAAVRRLRRLPADFCELKAIEGLLQREPLKTPENVGESAAI